MEEPQSEDVCRCLRCLPVHACCLTQGLTVALRRDVARAVQPSGCLHGQVQTSVQVQRWTLIEVSQSYRAAGFICFVVLPHPVRTLRVNIPNLIINLK
jgi:hypothetical protein